MAERLIGQTLGGCQLLEVLAKGGMGIIYKGLQKSLDRFVAVKVLAPHLANDINFVTRFQKEARAIARINHPNILAVYDVGAEGDVNYMIMELIEGCSLTDLQARHGGPLPWEDAANYTLQAAQGLEAAQAAGIVHRDIKPENLMITLKGQVKVSDFGLAKESGDASLRTSVETVMGTPAFMSPEQCEGKKTDGRTDIYSLGGTLYWLVVGRLPFEAETAMAMMYRQKHEPLVPPAELVPTLPLSISNVIVKMMAKKPEDRYRTMGAVIEAIEQARQAAAPGGSQSAAKVLGVGPPPAGGTAAYLRGVAGGSSAGLNTDMALKGLGQSATKLPVQRDQGPLSRGGLPSAGGIAVDEGYALVAHADALLAKGDKLGAMKTYWQALHGHNLDDATRARAQREVAREMSIRRQAIISLTAQGALLEASRDCRGLAEILPTEASLRELLKEIEQKLAQKRALVNEVRNAIAKEDPDAALNIWDAAPADLRDEALGKQMEHLRLVILPAVKLAAQGEALSGEGRLEEAVVAFEDALKINPICEPARAGLQEAEQKIQRIEYLLKEGYQYSLEQNFTKAVETWKPILEIQPGHPQTLKNMVEAYLAQAQALRVQGDLETAQDLYRRAVQTDPGNRMAAHLLEETTALREREQKLVERALAAATRKRLGEAMRCWREVHKLNPANKRAVQEVRRLAAQRGNRRALAVGVVLLAAGAGLAGWQYYQESAALAAARQALDEERYPDVVHALRSQKFYFRQTEAREARIEAAGKAEVQIAADLKKEGRLVEAANLYHALAVQLHKLDRAVAQTMAAEALLCEATSLHSLAHSQIAARQWNEAAETFARLAGLLQVETALPPGLKDSNDEATLALACLQKLDAGTHEKKENKRAAIEDFEAARKVAGDLKQLDAAYAACEDFAREELRALGYDPHRYQELLDLGIAKLKQEPPDFDSARSDFQAASKLSLDSAAGTYAQFAKDLAFCDEKGMSLYSPDNLLLKPGRTTWGRDERKAAFCIDRYEWPNQPGAMPLANVSFVEAAWQCEGRGKKLCSRLRWTDACKAYDVTRLYPYGDGRTPSQNFCNTAGTGPVGSGTKPCRNALGLYDMSGNLAEWADNDEANTGAVMGGSYRTAPEKANCGLDFDQEAKTTKAAHIGFRCCADLP